MKADRNYCDSSLPVFCQSFAVLIFHCGITLGVNILTVRVHLTSILLSQVLKLHSISVFYAPETLCFYHRTNFNMFK